MLAEGDSRGGGVLNAAVGFDMKLS